MKTKSFDRFVFESIFSPMFPTRCYVFTIFLVLYLSSTGSPASKTTYDADCSPNERLRCRVEEGTCATSAQSDDFPSAPFDLRVSPYMVANPTRKPNSYQLLVNITWSPTHEYNINKTQGFEVTILDKETNRQWCFLLRLHEPTWEDKDRHESTRFRFTTFDMFDYGRNYYVEIQSLPKPLNRSASMKRNNFVGLDAFMPEHPDDERILTEQLNQTGYFEPTSPRGTLSDYCTPSSSRLGSHPQASRWVAAFRYVYIQPKLRWIYVDFIAAPSQYCFEEYELRLLDATRFIFKNKRIKRDELVHELHDDVWVAFGNHTFTNVSVGMYEVGVMPVAHSGQDGRCLCPMASSVCTCSFSIWPEVEMPAPPTIVTLSNPCDHLPPVKLPFDCPMNNGSLTAVGDGKGNDTDGGMNVSTAMAMLICLVVGALALIALGLLILFIFYRRYKRKGAPRMYLLPLSNTETDMAANGSTSREMSTILHPIKLTLIYSHDSPDYDRLVRDLVDYLSTQCSCQVRVDYLCSTDIAANKFDWAYKSIVDADRVLLLNSYGAYTRFRAKLVDEENEAFLIERADHREFDDLFLLQLDFLNQEYQKNRHPFSTRKIVSARFQFTPDDCILPQADQHFRYELPKHFRSLMIDLHRLSIFSDDDQKDSAGNEISMPAQLKKVNRDEFDQCVEGRRLKESLESTNRFIRQQPDWFEKLHVRRSLVVKEKIADYRSAESDRIFDNRLIDNPLLQNGYVIDNRPTGDRSIDNRLINHSIGDQSIDNRLLDNSSTPLENNQNDVQSTSPLLAKNEASFSDRTKSYGDSVDSGVGNSSTKPSQQNGVSSYAKKPNGLVNVGNENDVRQRLIA